MIKINITEDKQLIKSVITNEILWDLHGYNGDKELFEPIMDRIWLKIEANTVLAGLFELKKFNNVVWESHIFILPPYQGTGISIKAIKEAKKFIKDNYHNIHKILLTVPASCEHVLKMLQKTEFKVCGAIKEGLIYHNQLQDLILFELTI
jgi:RimJ/RimL family protein N-acetyltransferase